MAVKVKKSLTSLDIAVVIRELRELEGCFIDNIYVDEGTGAYVFKIKGSEGVKYLLIEPGVRIHLTRYIVKLSHAGRVGLFRRFCRGAKISLVRQVGFERIVEIVVRRREDEYVVIVELLPRGIVAVVDSKTGKVLVSSSDIKVKDRSVFPGSTYRYPPLMRDFRELSPLEWVDALKEDKIGRGLVRKLGIPPEVVNEVLPGDIRNSKLGQGEEALKLAENLKKELTEFIDNVIKNPVPVLVEYGGEPVAFHPFKPTRIYGSECVFREYSSMSELLDEYFTSIVKRQLASALSEGEEGKLQRLLKQAEERVKELEEELVRVRRKLELIEENYYQLEETLGCVRRVLDTVGWEGISNCGVRVRDRSRGVIEVVIKGVSLELEVTKTLSEQYVELRKSVASITRKLERARKSVSELSDKLREYGERRKKLSMVKPLVRRVEWYMQFRWIITSGGYLAIGGRNREQNEKIVRKYLEDRDIFVHADIQGAPVFVIKCGGKEPSEVDLKEVGILAVAYSKGWKVGMGALSAFWVWGKQVSKTPPPGEYLPKGAFMIRGERKFLKDLELKLALGVRVINDSYYEIIAGPEELIKSRSLKYVVLAPGDIKPSKLAKIIRDYFVSGYPQLRNLTEEEILRELPGPGRILFPRELVESNTG